MLHPKPSYKLILERRHENGLHTPGWWLLLSWMLESMDVDNRNVPIMVWCRFCFDMERCHWKHISQTKIELENNNHTLETNDCNLENTSYSIQKAKVSLQKEEERDRGTHFLQIQRENKSQYTKENTVRNILSWGHRGRDISEYGKQAGEIHSHPGKSKRKVVRTQKEGN